MNIGFTGTQIGMSLKQKAEFRDLLRALSPQYDAIFHHGDCIGADYEAAMIAQNEFGFITVSHPPSNASKRAFHKSTVVYEPKEYLDRNKDIVRACNVLIAAPKSDQEETRSGTWSTVRFARKNKKEIRILPRA